MYCVQSTSSPILKSLVLVVHLSSWGFLSLCLVKTSKRQNHENNFLRKAEFSKSNLTKTHALVQWCTSEESIFLSFSPLLNLIKVAFLILLLFLILELNTKVDFYSQCNIPITVLTSFLPSKLIKLSKFVLA